MYKILRKFKMLINCLILNIPVSKPIQTPADLGHLRNCPKDANDLALIYSVVFTVFKEIQDHAIFYTMMQEMQYAAMPLCKTWDDYTNIPPVPQVMDSPFECVITPMGERMSYSIWVLWFDSRVEVVTPYANRGISRYLDEHFTLMDKPDPMPKGVVKAARIQIGVIGLDNSLVGYQWNLYRNRECINV